MVDDERLIDLVQANDLLYNRNNLNYKSYEKKKKAWAAIASELGVPEDVAAKRYRNLRDRFVREKRVELLNGTENTYRAPIVQSMDFLIPHIFTKNPIVDRVACSAKKTDPLQPTSYTSDSTMHITPKSPDQDEYEDTMFEMQYSPEHHPSIVGFKRKAVETTRLDNDATAAAATKDIDDAFCGALRSFQKLCQTREERRENEALHGFGQMIVATIAGMNTEKQTRAMLRVTELVMQIKLEPDQTS